MTYATTLDEVFALRSEVARLRELLSEAYASRGPDVIDAIHPGWADRTLNALTRPRAHDEQSADGVTK